MKNLVVFGLILFSPLALAAGGRESGGGSYVVIDGKTTLADPYYAGVPSKEIRDIVPISYDQLPETLRLFTAQILDYVHRQTGENTLRYTLEAGDEKNYFLVPKEREANVPCHLYLPLLNRPVDDHFQFGCTLGKQTYLFIDKFDKAPIQQQALALVHERMWTRTDDQAKVTRFTTSLDLLYNRYVAQIRDGDRSAIPENERQALRDVFSILGIRRPPVPPSDSTLAAGGGLIDPSCAGKLKDSFVGLGSVISKCHSDTIVSRSEIIGSTVDLSGRLSVENTKILESTLTTRLIMVYRPFSSWEYERQRLVFALISKSTVAASLQDSIGTEEHPIVIQDSDLPLGASMIMGKGSRIIGFRSYANWQFNGVFRVRFGDHAIFENITIRSPIPDRRGLVAKSYSLRVEPNTEIKNGKIVIEQRCGDPYKADDFPQWGGLHTFIFGAENSTFSLDLKGGELTFKPKGWFSGSCWPRYPEAN